MAGILGLRLIRLLLLIGVTMSWSAQATTLLDDKLVELETLPSWQQVVKLGEQLQGHPDLSEEQLQSLIERLGHQALKYQKYAIAIRYFSQLENLTEHKPLSDTFYSSVKLQGIATYHLGHFIEAAALYHRALDLATERKTPLEIANIHSNLGLSYMKTYQLELATAHYVAAHQLYEIHGNKQDKADIMLNLSGVYIRQLRFTTAEKMLLRAVKLFIELEDDYGTALTQANLGVIYRHMGRYALSRVNQMAAIKYYESSKDWQSLSIEYANLANLSLEENKLDQSLVEANFALYYAEHANSTRGRRAALHPLAQVQFAQKEYALAKESAIELIALSQDAGVALNEKQGYLLLSIIEAALDKPEQALKNHRRYDKLKRELLNRSTGKKLEQYQASVAENELNQEIKTLKQFQALQKLQIEQREQLVWLCVLLILTVGIAGVSIYRKRVLQHTKMELSRQVAERTAQLQQVADELREANQVKSQFLANISHEIRTPLTSILGHTEALLLEHKRDDALQESLKVVHRQGEHLRELICDVLDLSKIEALQFELELSEFELDDLLTDISDMFQHACVQKGLKFIIHNQLLDTYIVKLDYIRIKQVLINLLGNAVKFTEQGCVELTVSMSNGALLFVIEDTGIGMDERNLNRIFDCFQQGDNTISRRFGGSGLGLSLSQQLIDMMGGKISVESSLNQGSKFSVLVPCLAEPHVSSMKKDMLVNPLEALSGKVLIAEDHDDNRALFSRLVSNFGPDVLVAHNGEAAIEVCLSEFPDLILMDIQMPKIDGLEAFRILRQAGFDGPIYALTANVMAREIKSYLEHGFTGHIGKPVDTQLLHQVLLKHLQQKDSYTPEIQIDMSDLTASFVQTLEQERYNIVDLWESKQIQPLRNACHRLAGASITFGFHDIANTAKQLDHVLSTPDQSQAQYLYLILCDELKLAAGLEQFNIV
jgi:signal transduction histidine kinase/DNA-binding NarL/FixJ family response regulator